MSTYTSHLSWVGDLVLKLGCSKPPHIGTFEALASGVEADLLIFPCLGCGGRAFRLPLPRLWRYSCSIHVCHCYAFLLHCAAVTLCGVVVME